MVYLLINTRVLKAKNNIYKLLIWVFLSIFLCYSCSTKKNTRSTRAYHELTTRYNVYFNAEESYLTNIKSQMDNLKDDYSALLPMYATSVNPSDTTKKKSIGGPFTTTVDKMVSAIQEHSISVKPPRDPSKSETQTYRDWLRQDEFNPFIDRAWLLMGKAHVENKDYTEAIAVFLQTSRLFVYDREVVAEAEIWMMRAYTEMGWFTDADALAESLKVRELPKNLKNDFNEFYTLLQIRKENYTEAITYLTKSIKSQGNIKQKKRLQFLLGQLYAKTGDKTAAYKAFNDVKGLNTPYEIAFNAMMQQSLVSTPNAQSNILKDLKSMTKSSKNSDFLDQIYYAIGNIHLGKNDTTKAIENYLLAESKSTRNGIDKALAQIALGDIYFERKDYVKAEPRYTEAIGVLPKNNKEYPRVKFRSEVLIDLAPLVANVHEQDSLQHLASLPYEEQLKIINDYIAEMKKREKELALESERDAYLAEQQAKAPDLGGGKGSTAEAAVAMAGKTGMQNTFYFYNPQAVSQGRNEFKRRWGGRKLEDNWRLLDKSGATFGGSSESDENGEALSTDSIAIGPDGKPIKKDEKVPERYKPEFYLSKLPNTPEKLAASNNIIEAGLYQSGNIVKDRLEDYRYAITLYNRHLKDFTESKDRPDVYYQMYLIYTRLGEKAMAQNYKNKILIEFPKSELAETMSDSNFERTMRNFAQMQDSLYQQTYKAYEKGDAQAVQKNYKLAQKLFAKGDLMPKFMLLNALAFAQSGDAQNTETALNNLVAKHPEASETVLAQNILTGLSEGKILAANASAMSGINWKIGGMGNSAQAIDSIPFDTRKDVPHSYMLMFAQKSIDKSSLLFAVSNFNFSKFQLRTFSTSFMQIYPFEMMQVKTFNSFDEAGRYADMIESDSTFRQNIPANIMPLIISDANLNLVEQGKPLNEYIVFIDSLYNVKPTIEEKPIVEKVNSHGVDSLGKDSINIENIDAIEKSLTIPIKQIEPITEPEKTVILQEVKVTVQSEKTGEEQLEIEPSISPQTQPSLEERQAELERKQEEAMHGNSDELNLKDREKNLKEKDKNRNQQIKQREREMKEREKQRKKEMKEREREREKQLKEQERMRKEKLKERERLINERKKQRK